MGIHHSMSVCHATYTSIATQIMPHVHLVVTRSALDYLLLHSSWLCFQYKHISSSFVWGLTFIAGFRFQVYHISTPLDNKHYLLFLHNIVFYTDTADMSYSFISFLLCWFSFHARIATLFYSLFRGTPPSQYAKKPICINCWLAAWKHFCVQLAGKCPSWLIFTICNGWLVTFSQLVNANGKWLVTF